MLMNDFQKQVQSLNLKDESPINKRLVKAMGKRITHDEIEETLAATAAAATALGLTLSSVAVSAIRRLK